MLRILCFFFCLGVGPLYSLSSWVDRVPKRQFQQLCEGPVPSWMWEQIHRDFREFYGRGITQAALAATYEQTVHGMYAPWGQMAYHVVCRYRTINGRIFRYGPQNTQTQEILRTLAKLGCLPNVDIVVSETDGTPEYYHPDNFWITKSIEQQAPVLAKSSMRNSRFIVLIPDYQSLIDWPPLIPSLLKANARRPWKKKENRAAWRGTTSDIHINNADALPQEELARIYRTRPRCILSLMSQVHPEYVDAGFSALIPYEGIVNATQGLEKLGMSYADQIAYKYLPILDGWACTYPGYLWRLLSNSTPFKVDSPMIQWFYDALKPYVHYVPVQMHLEDFFSAIDWARADDASCERIAHASTEFVKNNLMPEHIWFYYFAVLREYESLQLFDTTKLLWECLHAKQWVEESR